MGPPPYGLAGFFGAPATELESRQPVEGVTDYDAALAGSGLPPTASGWRRRRRGKETAVRDGDDLRSTCRSVDLAESHYLQP